MDLNSVTTHLLLIEKAICFSNNENKRIITRARTVAMHLATPVTMVEMWTLNALATWVVSTLASKWRVQTFFQIQSWHCCWELLAGAGMNFCTLLFRYDLRILLTLLVLSAKFAWASHDTIMAQRYHSVQIFHILWQYESLDSNWMENVETVVLKVWCLKTRLWNFCTFNGTR